MVGHFLKDAVEMILPLVKGKAKILGNMLYVRMYSL